MISQILNDKLKKWLKALKPWAIYIAILIVLRYTGLLAGISYLASTAIMHTGAMDAGINSAAPVKNFNYNFKLLNLDKNTVDVRTFKGKTIFLNMWATWCGPCRVEMPSIQKLYEQVDKDKVVFIMLSLDQQDPLNKAKKYVEEKGFTFPVYIPSGDLPAQLRVSSIPTTFVISPEGKIVNQETGAANYNTNEFREYLEGL